MEINYVSRAECWDGVSREKAAPEALSELAFGISTTVMCNDKWEECSTEDAGVEGMNLDAFLSCVETC